MNNYQLPQPGDRVQPRKGYLYHCPAGAIVTKVDGNRVQLNDRNEWYIRFKLEKLVYDWEIKKPLSV